MCLFCGVVLLVPSFFGMVPKNMLANIKKNCTIQVWAIYNVELVVSFRSKPLDRSSFSKFVIWWRLKSLTSLASALLKVSKLSAGSKWLGKRPQTRLCIYSVCLYTQGRACREFDCNKVTKYVDYAQALLIFGMWADKLGEGGAFVLLLCS